MFVFHAESYMEKSESYIKLKRLACMLWYYLKLHFRNQCWCDLLTSVAVVSNLEYREEQLTRP